MHCVSLLPSTMSGDELLLWQGPGQGNSQQEYFWTNFVKGAARSATLLFLLALTKGAGWELQVLHAQLYETVLAIHCRCDTCLDVQAAAYQNAVLSQAGSIRKAHDVPTWLAKIQFLLQKGVSAETVIKSWNARATREGQLQGAKRTRLLNLLQCPQPALDILQRHASSFGTSTAFAEEAFSVKQILPGHTPRLPVKAWGQRLRGEASKTRGGQQEAPNGGDPTKHRNH